RSGRQQKLSV
ncbi:molybdopterin oxidoreductase family protein, partial [Vibrio parahaemolyticus V-223/04]